VFDCVSFFNYFKIVSVFHGCASLSFLDFSHELLVLGQANPDRSNPAHRVVELKIPPTSTAVLSIDLEKDLLSSLFGGGEQDDEWNGF